jgi:Ser/Thr protein kinase RdoA (MazF antagonist)
MNLNFMINWPDHAGGGRTNFPEKILASLIQHYRDEVIDFYKEKHGIHIYDPITTVDLFKTAANYDFNYNFFWKTYEKAYPAKIHTFRSNFRWTEATKIHFQIWTGKPYNTPTFQFAPVIQCVSTQKIEIIYAEHTESPFIWLDDKPFNDSIYDISVNDGFPTLNKFNKFFNKDFEGQILHWTPYKYI